MIDKIKAHIAKVEAFATEKKEELEQFRLEYLGKKGLLNDFFAQFKEVPKEEKKEFGQIINELKSKAEAKINELKERLGGQSTAAPAYNDLTRPAFPIEIGSRHPVSLIKNKIIEIFANIGFSIAEGPEIEDDWHNFTALNLPEYHPARDMQDTFFIQTRPDILLHTHTSSVEVRYMEQNQPPIRIIAPGRVYRNEDITKGTGWLEIMGCGMTDPNVLKNCNIDPEKYSGFAFGIGLERVAMLLYQIGDIRAFYENDVRFLEQFKSSI